MEPLSCPSRGCFMKHNLIYVLSLLDGSNTPDDDLCALLLVLQEVLVLLIGDVLNGLEELLGILPPSCLCNFFLVVSEVYSAAVM